MLPTAAHAATAAAAAAVPMKDSIVAIYGLLASLLVRKDPKITEELEALDLSSRVRIVAAVLDDLVELTNYKSIKLAKQDLAATLEDIKAALERLNALTETYSEAYFASWRYGTLQACLCTVVTLSGRLKQRLARLLLLMPLNHL